jgi:GDP-D-mannose 3',5'-epimerase|tara:strand:- start:67 stop:336 length:270 start_codon:yes stop_codon:yes gene_type:complete
MNQFAAIALSFENKSFPIKHIDGPEGVRGRNSNNVMILEKLGWEPKIPISEGLKKTYFWIKEQIEADESGKDFSKSEIVVQTEDSLLKL